MIKTLLSAAALWLAALPALAQSLGATAQITTTPPVQNAAYVSGNALGSLQTLSVFRNQFIGSGLINDFWISSKGGSVPAITVYIFRANPTGTTCTDKTAFVMGAADRPNLATPPFVVTLAVVGVGDTATYADAANLGKQVKNSDPQPTNQLYVCLVTGTGFTPASISDIFYTISVTLD